MDNKNKIQERIREVTEIEKDLFSAIEVLKTKRTQSEINRINEKINVLQHRYVTYKAYQST